MRSLLEAPSQQELRTRQLFGPTLLVRCWPTAGRGGSGARIFAGLPLRHRGQSAQGATAQVIWLRHWMDPGVARASTDGSWPARPSLQPLVPGSAAHLGMELCHGLASNAFGAPIWGYALAHGSQLHWIGGGPAAGLFGFALGQGRCRESTSGATTGPQGASLLPARLPRQYRATRQRALALACVQPCMGFDSGQGMAAEICALSSVVDFSA